MNLEELKKKSPAELILQAEKLEIEKDNYHSSPGSLIPRMKV